jgi:hypothetical protein
MSGNAKFTAIYGGVAATSLLSVPPALAGELQSDTTPLFDHWAGLSAGIQTVPIHISSGSNLISEVVTLFQSESRPISSLGRRLQNIRERALAKGLQLLDAAEISEEVASRRGET